jgi:hypothetical protein
MPGKKPTLGRVPFVEFMTKVLGLTISPTWRVLLSVAVDKVQPKTLSDTPPAVSCVYDESFVKKNLPSDREIARVLFGDVDTIPPDVNELMVWRLGRGAAKTTTASAMGIWTMLTAPLDRVGPGMLAACVVIAPRRDLAKNSVRVARELVRSVPAIEALISKTGDTSDGFDLERPDYKGKKVRFVAVAASRGGSTVRGFDILQLILDESEFFTSNTSTADEDGYAVSDREIYAAAEPRLLGSAVLISTPWPVANMTAEYFDTNYGKPSTALVCKGNSLFMRPGDLKLQRKIFKALSNPINIDNARREYFCEPGMPGAERLFSADVVDAAMVERPVPVTHAPKGAFVGTGGDLGLERDSSAVAVVSNLRGEYELHEYEEIRPKKGSPLAPGFVVKDRFGRVMKAHHAKAIMMDNHYRQSAKEHLDTLGYRFLHAPEGVDGKYNSYMHLRTLLHEGRIRLPEDKRLREQLLSVVAKPMPGGKSRIAIPRRAGDTGHGDIVSALVLACWAAKKKSKDKTTESPKPIVRPSGDNRRLDGDYAGYGWENLPLDGGGGINVSMGASRPPTGAGLTPGATTLAAHEWLNK